MTTIDTHDLLAELMAKQQITQALHSYCRGLDRMDRTLAESVWHADGTADYGPGYRGTGSGFLDFVWGFHAGFENHSHMVSNAIIELDLDNDKAASETYVAVWLRTAPENGTVRDHFHRGRYVDAWSRRDGIWAIDHRIYLGDMICEDEHPVGPGADLMPIGSRDRTDRSYEVLS